MQERKIVVIKGSSILSTANFKTEKKTKKMNKSKFPITYKVTNFPQDADKRDIFLSDYAYEVIVKSEQEQRKFFESFDGGENIIISEL